MAYYNRTPEPKPYKLIDLPFEVEITRKKPAGHHKFIADRRSGQLHLNVEALSPVHVASGLIERKGYRQHPLVKSLLRVGETPVIPGSSFKGCVRSIVEAISPSCVRVTRARRQQVPRQLQECRKKEQLCLACRIFGAQDYLGLIRFSDFRLKEVPNQAITVAQVPPFYRPRNREGLYYSEEGRKRYVRGRKFYMHGTEQARDKTPIEVCETGSHFEGIIDFTNLDDAELGLLLLALGQSTNYPLYLKLGGAKPACFGSLQVHVTKLAILSDAKERYSSWDAPAETIEDVSQYVRKSTKFVLIKQFKQLVETLRWPNDRNCPSGNY